MGIFFTIVLCLIIGFIIRPYILKLVNKIILTTFNQDKFHYEIEFQIQFYHQPSAHITGKTGELIKFKPVKIMIKANSEDEALDIFNTVVEHEVKIDLLSITKV